MENQVLNVNQMKHLKELGVDISKASMKLVSIYPSSDCDEDVEYVAVGKSFHSKMYNEIGFVFNIQDVLEFLPKKIKGDDNNEYLIKIDFINGCWGVTYSYDDGYFTDGCIEIFSKYSKNLLDAAYEMLCELVIIGKI